MKYCHVCGLVLPITYMPDYWNVKEPTLITPNWFRKIHHTASCMQSACSDRQLIVSVSFISKLIMGSDYTVTYYEVCWFTA
jgi:hypothetical protein